jgi:hypothetical protein
MGHKTTKKNPPRNRRLLEQRRPNLLVAGGLTGALLLAGAIWWSVGSGAADTAPLVIPGERRRVQTEVLNGTSIDGLARRMTLKLRERGVDVVFFGSASTNTTDSTIVIARRGDMAAAERVRDLLGVGKVVDEPAAQLLLDVTVVLGRDADPSVSTRN